MSIRVDSAVTDADAVEVWSVYESVFGDAADLASWRAGMWDRHTARGGFLLARAYEESSLVGFAYGYTGQPGQWWTDQASEVLARDVADEWLGGHFELVSIGVHAEARRGGVGRLLLRALLDGLPHERLLLMTSADPADPARRLYAQEGGHLLGPGIGEETVIMGRRIAH